MKKPIILVTGVEPDAMAATVLALQWDLPHAVVVRHHIDVARSVLERVVSDITGVVERAEIDLQHVCVACAIREDVIPTLHRVAHDPRWGSVIAHLPVSAEADQVCAVLAGDQHLARTMGVSSVVTAVDGQGLEDDLIGDDLLCERDLEIATDDRRGVGEVLAGMVEFADIVVVNGAPHPAGLDLVHTLTRPDARIVKGAEMLDPQLVRDTAHDLSLTRAWTDPMRTRPLPPVTASQAWRVDLHSARPFHPGRLFEAMSSLGTGRHRSKGCFWLPTRPEHAVLWQGAGGQVSIGTGQPWGGRARHTRIVITGTNTPPAHLHDAFTAMLLRHDEAYPSTGEDGFEPWLGPTRDVA